MGDTLAVEFAQASHIGLCLRYRVAHPDEMLTLQGSIPRGLLQVGVIVDDLIVLERITRASFDEGALTESESRIGAAREAYDATNLINNPAKGFVKEVGAPLLGAGA